MEGMRYFSAMDRVMQEEGLHAYLGRGTPKISKIPVWSRARSLVLPSNYGIFIENTTIIYVTINFP